MEDFTPTPGDPMPLNAAPKKADMSGWKRGVSLEKHAPKGKKPGSSLKTVLFAIAWGILLSYAVVVSMMYYKDYTARYDAGYDMGKADGYNVAYRDGWDNGYHSGYDAGESDANNSAWESGYALAQKVYTGQALTSDEQFMVRLHNFGQS